MTGPDPTGGREPATRPADLERGLRGVISAILVLEAIVILLGIPVAENVGHRTGAVGLALILALAAAHLVACAVVSRPFAFVVVGVLQALLVACWAINGALGVMGIVFVVVWVIVYLMRREFRRRVAAGLVPSGARATADPGGPPDHGAPPDGPNR